jgi:hypothetical protein
MFVIQGKEFRLMFDRYHVDGVNQAAYPLIMVLLL